MYTSYPIHPKVDRQPTMVGANLQGPPPCYDVARPQAPLPQPPASRGKINAYLHDVFELPKLKDHMNQYNLVMDNLGRQKTINEMECKHDMKYHKNRYSDIYTRAMGSPSLGPVKGLNTSPWPSSKSVDHPLTNDNIYIDTKRKKTGDKSLFLAPWRVLKEDFPPVSGAKKPSARPKLEVIRSGGRKSGAKRMTITLASKPTPEQLERARSLVAPYLEPKTTNSVYGSTTNSTVNTPEPGHKPLAPLDSPRRYKAPHNADWKTEAWRRANQEYRAYREATQLSSIPLNRRVSNFIFGGNVVIA